MSTPQPEVCSCETLPKRNNGAGIRFWGQTQDFLYTCVAISAYLCMPVYDMRMPMCICMPVYVCVCVYTMSTVYTGIPRHTHTGMHMAFTGTCIAAKVVERQSQGRGCAWVNFPSPTQMIFSSQVLLQTINIQIGFL